VVQSGGQRFNKQLTRDGCSLSGEWHLLLKNEHTEQSQVQDKLLANLSLENKAESNPLIGLF
jgi:hypothetical protein